MAPPSCWSRPWSEDDLPLIQLICDETDRICALVDRMEEFGDTAPMERARQHPSGAGACPPHRRRPGLPVTPTVVELYDPSLPEVEGDRDRLVQVFLNLVKNAAEAAPSRQTARSHWPPSTSTASGSP